jgi:hypothetical protein
MIILDILEPVYRNFNSSLVSRLAIFFEDDFSGFMLIVALQDIYLFIYQFFHHINSRQKQVTEHRILILVFQHKFNFHAPHILISS